MSRATYLKKIKKKMYTKKQCENENNINQQKSKAIISDARKQYLKKIKVEKISVIATQIIIVIAFIAIWEILANNGIIDSFIMSSPSRILNTFLNLAQNDLVNHIFVTCTETIIGFLLGTILGAIIAIILWWSKFISKVSEPFLVVLNSLPKIALRTSNNYMGRSRNACNNCNGACNFIDSNNFRNIKRIYKYR